ncbi:MAG: hypothetical protein FJW31_23930 [Acidobacteria bacterium]|nr:hypothetical protein [Acidobacteriota bacterium]
MIAAGALLFLIGAVGASADTRFEEIAAKARLAQAHAQEVEMGLKNKRAIEAATIRNKLHAVGAEIKQMQSLVADLETKQPGNLPAAEWRLLKEKVQLLAILHERKAELAMDVEGNRSLLRAHAKGTVLRASKLQQTATSLRQASGSTSNAGS